MRSKLIQQIEELERKGKVYDALLRQFLDAVGRDYV